MSCCIRTSSTIFTHIPIGLQHTPSGVELHKDEKSFVDTVAGALGVKKMRVVETGGTAYMRERTQWDSGANLVCASPGVVFAYDRNTYTNTPAAQGGHRGHNDYRSRARPRPRRRSLHDLPYYSGRRGLTFQRRHGELLCCLMKVSHSGNFVVDAFAVFMFIVWFWLLITVLGDLFRRHDVSGFSKVLWVILLIVLPYIGIFAYLLTTKGTAWPSRNQARANEARNELRQIVGFSVADELVKLDQLKAKGTISQQEYTNLRAKII